MVNDELRRELRELYRAHDLMMAEAREADRAESIHYKVTETPARRAEPSHKTNLTLS